MFGTLSVSQSGLNAAKRAVENVSNNLANENTPGYKKRVVQLSEIEHTETSFTGRGVSTDFTYRITSQYLYDKMMSENSKMDYHDKLSNILGSVEKIYKETKESGLTSDISRYFKSVENLRSNPNSSVYKNNLKSHATLLVKSMQNIYKGMNQYENLIKNELEENLSLVNNYTSKIAQINKKIEVSISSSKNDLLDKRDLLEKKLSKLVNIEVLREKGSYELLVSGKSVVFNTSSAELNLETIHTPQINNYVKNDGKTSNIDFGAGGFDTDDTITYKLNNEHEVSVTFGESIDIDGDGTPETVDQTNYIRALVSKINKDPKVSQLVSASNGHKEDTSLQNIDKFLSITSKKEGTEGKFEAYLALEKKTGATIDDRKTFYENEYQSDKAISKVKLRHYNEEIELETGVMKAQIDNLQSDSNLNKIQDYKDKLDLFAKTLADITDKYITTGKDKYIYGESTVDTKVDNIIKIGLFSGSSVMKMKFNSNAVNDLKQDHLEYLSTMQWKKDISFSGKAQDPNDESAKTFTQYYKEVRISVSTNKEDNDFLLKTQKVIAKSIESTHEQLTKVDKDEQMIDIIKFQSAYTSNAKVITTIDEMLKTLLGLKK